MNKKLIYVAAVALLTASPMTCSILSAQADSPFPFSVFNKKDVLVELDDTHDGDYKYSARTSPRDKAVMDALAQIVEHPSEEMAMKRGGRGTQQPLGLRLSGVGKNAEYIYHSGYTREPDKLQQEFAYDLATFQNKNGVPMYVKELSTQELAKEPAALKELRYHAYETFATAWWTANSRTFEMQTPAQKKEWTYEALADGGLLYSRYLIEKAAGASNGDVLTNFNVYESDLYKAHVLNNNRLRV